MKQKKTVRNQLNVLLIMHVCVCVKVKENKCREKNYSNNNTACDPSKLKACTRSSAQTARARNIFRAHEICLIVLFAPLFFLRTKTEVIAMIDLILIYTYLARVYEKSSFFSCIRDLFSFVRCQFDLSICKERVHFLRVYFVIAIISLDVSV